MTLNIDFSVRTDSDDSMFDKRRQSSVVRTASDADKLAALMEAFRDLIAAEGLDGDYRFIEAADAYYEADETVQAEMDGEMIAAYDVIDPPPAPVRPFKVGDIVWPIVADDDAFWPSHPPRVAGRIVKVHGLLGIHPYEVEFPGWDCGHGGSDRASCDYDHWFCPANKLVKAGRPLGTPGWLTPIPNGDCPF